jgi:hypothetical protein
MAVGAPMAFPTDVKEIMTSFALDTFHGRAGSGERDCELVSGRALELRPEVFHDRLHPDGAQHFELSGLRLDAEHKQKSERIFIASSCEMANLRA